MVAFPVPRPKPTSPKVNANYRVDEVLRDKFAFACAARLSDATKQVVAFMTSYVAGYEEENGEIKLPAKPDSAAALPH